MGRVVGFFSTVSDSRSAAEFSGIEAWLARCKVSLLKGPDEPCVGPRLKPRFTERIADEFIQPEESGPMPPRSMQLPQGSRRAHFFSSAARSPPVVSPGLAIRVEALEPRTLLSNFWYVNSNDIGTPDGLTAATGS